MNQIEREVYVLDNRIKNPIDYVQSTNTIPIVFHFRDYTIPSGATALVYVRKPSGLAVYNSAEISGNSVTVDVTTQMFIEEGFHSLQIQIANGEDDLVTFDQPVQVYKNRTDPDAAESENESSLFEELQEAAQEATDAADAANEAADTANEAAQSANQAAQNANDAADSANDAADLANSTAQAANQAADAANDAASSANNAADAANQATQSANSAANAANDAADSANSAADSANQAAQAANDAAQAVEEAVGDVINDDQVSNVTTYSSQKLTEEFLRFVSYLPENGDVNDYINRGHYYASTANAPTLANAPFSYAFHMTVISTALNCVQVAYRISQNATKMRVGYDNGASGLNWTSWTDIILRSELDPDEHNLITYTSLDQLGLTTQNTITDIMNALPLHSVADIGVSASGEAPLNLSLPVIGAGRLIVSKQTTDARGTAKFYVYSSGDTYENKWYNSAFIGWYRHLTSVGNNTIADGVLALLNGYLNITRETDPYVNLFNLAGGGDRVGIHWYGTATGQNTFGVYDQKNSTHLMTISQSTRQAKFAGNIVDGDGNVLSGKLTASGIVNNATTTASGYVLDGRMGKTLNDKIVQLQNNTGNFKFRMGTVTVNCPPGEPGATYISYSGFTQPPKVFATVVSTWAEFLTLTVDPNNTTTQARVRVFNRNTASGGQWNGPVNWIAIGL